MADTNAPLEGNNTPASEGGENPAAAGSPKTFTQEQVNQLVGSARVKEREKYANHEEYKKAFEELNELKESQKSELEKVTSRAEKAEAELEELKRNAEADKWRKEVSDESGVPVEAISGSTKEEMQEHAEVLKKYFPDSKKPVLPSDGNAPGNVPGGGSGDWLRNALKGI